MKPGQLFWVKTKHMIHTSRADLQSKWFWVIFEVTLFLSLYLIFPVSQCYCQKTGVQPACNQGQTNAAWATLTELKWDGAMQYADVCKTDILNLCMKCLNSLLLIAKHSICTMYLSYTNIVMWNQCFYMSLPDCTWYEYSIGV